MSDTLKERKIYRILTNSASKAWDKIAFWTTAKSVDAADGNNLETKVGAIKGITTSTSTTTKGYAADATVIKTLNDSLGKIRVYVGTDGKLHYVDKAGADSVLNFSGGKKLLNIELFSYIMAGSAYYGNAYGTLIPCEQYSKVKIRAVDDGQFNFQLYGGTASSQNIILLYTHTSNKTYSNDVNIANYDYFFLVSTTGRTGAAYMFTD